jgi:hypothetical protein
MGEDRPVEGRGHGSDAEPAEVAPPRDAFVELADEAQHEMVVRERIEARARRERSSELATWLGTLRDLAERGADVVLRGSSGDVHRGRLVGVALDHVTLALPTGARLLVPLTELRQLSSRSSRGLPPAAGDRDAAQDRLLVDALERCLEQRRTVVLRLRDLDAPLRGELVALGDDVLTVRADGAGGTHYVPVEAIAEVLLPG